MTSIINSPYFHMASNIGMMIIAVVYAMKSNKYSTYQFTSIDKRLVILENRLAMLENLLNKPIFPEKSDSQLRKNEEKKVLLELMHDDRLNNDLVDDDIVNNNVNDIVNNIVNDNVNDIAEEEDQLIEQEIQKLRLED